MKPKQTISQALSQVTAELTEQGIDSPRLDAELLLAEVLKVDRTSLVIDSQRELTEFERTSFEELVRRRRAREPVAYILGQKYFRNLTILVDASVLVPRPETELLVEVALELPLGAAVLDVGTGSGAIALAIKHERPDLIVTASDISADALAVAGRNKDQLQLDVELVQADLLNGIGGDFDLIISNPPYVAEAERSSLDPELSYEPDQALFAGQDGLDCYRKLIPSLVGRAKQVALEIGATQADSVSSLLLQVGFSGTEIINDLAGHSRVVKATW